MNNDIERRNKKALREQGSSKHTKTPTTVAKAVQGDYTRFEDIAIGCIQFLSREPVTANLRVGQTRQCNGVRLSISGRAGRAELFLTSPEQIDELVERLERLKTMQFGDQGAIE